MWFSIRRTLPGGTLAVLICASMALVIGIAAALTATSSRVFRSEPPGLLNADRILDLTAIDNYVLFDELRSATDAADLAAYSRGTTSVASSTSWNEVGLVCVTDGFFPTMGISALAGRLLTGSPSAEVVVTDRLVERLYGDSYRSAVGRSLQIGRTQYSIVGIVQGNLGQAITARADVWLSLDAAPVLCSGLGYDRRSSVSASWLVTVARLRPGRRVGELQDRVREVVAKYPKQGEPKVDLSGPPRTVRDDFIAGLRKERLLLSALNGGGVVLLIVGTWNATGFLLLGALARQRDFQIRVALGASQRQLMAAVVQEPLVVFVMATVLGWPVAHVVSLGLSDFMSVSERPAIATEAILVALWGCACFAIPAAVCATAVQRKMSKRLLSDGWSTLRGTRLDACLRIAAIAVPCAALIAGASFGRTLQNILADLGYEPNSLLVVGVDPQRSRYALDEDVQAYRNQLANELAVRFPNSPAALASLGPLDFSGPRQFIIARGQPNDRGQLTSIHFISESYFRVVGTGLLAGRAPEAAAAEAEAVIDKGSERSIFGDSGGLGKCLYLMASLRCVRIVGVSPTRRARMLRESSSELFVPVGDASTYGLGVIGRTILVRVHDSDKESLLSHVQVRDVPVQTVGADELVSAQSGPWRLGLRSLTTMGIVAMLLSMVGVAASVALNVRSRVSELRIRLLLGARKASVIWLLLRRVLISMVGGIIVGVGAATVLVDLVQHRIVSVVSVSTDVALAVAGAVGIATVMGSLLPAIGASRLNVSDAIRRQIK